MTDESSLPFGKKLCECGCGAVIQGYDKRHGLNRRFKSGHNSKLALNNRWKGGVRMSNGYRMIRMPEHARADKNGYVLEHIMVLEQKLGRSLLPDEHTHHLNGIRDDNRPENLTNLMHIDHSRLHLEKDMSGRRCCECGRGTIGRRWHIAGLQKGQFRCSNCYHKAKHHNGRTRKLSADISH
jgi:HNH endonuclease